MRRKRNHCEKKLNTMVQDGICVISKIFLERSFFWQVLSSFEIEKGLENRINGDFSGLKALEAFN